MNINNSELEMNANILELEMNSNDFKLEMKILRYLSVNLISFKKEELVEHLHDNLKIYTNLKIHDKEKIPKEEIQSALTRLDSKGLLYHDNDDTICIDTNAIDYSFEEQYDRIKSLTEKMNSKFNSIDDRIDDFNKNIITIMSLLIGAFAIIGFNISGIKFIVSDKEALVINEYVLSIIVINISIVVSLYFLFFLLNRVMNKPNDGKHSRIFGLWGFLIVSVLVVFAIFLLVYFKS